MGPGVWPDLPDLTRIHRRLPWPSIIAGSPLTPGTNYSGVVMEQGRVQSDSDWNEWLAETRRAASRPARSTSLGHAAYPGDDARPPFRSPPRSAGGSNSILDRLRAACMSTALLAENHGLSANAQWDPGARRTLRIAATAAAITAAANSSNTIDFAHQPYLPRSRHLADRYGQRFLIGLSRRLDAFGQLSRKTPI